MRKEEYIESGYEPHLKQLLKSNYDSILINGAFGTGKTTMLNHVLDSDEFKGKKILELKVYEEYVEENYIDFLYEKLFYEQKRNTNKIKQFFKENLKIIASTIVDAVLIVLLAAINFRLKDGIASGVYVIFILLALYCIFSILKVRNQNKLEKLEYIKKELEQYDFIIIDDLDRVYFDTNEILKMIQFLSEVNLKFKLILLSDKDKFEKNKIDVLEKYYDISFEIPCEIIVQQKVKLFINNLEEIEYKDDIEKIRAMLYQLNIRTLNKVINHYEYDKENNLQIVEQLFRSDYIFIIILYYKYGEYESVINSLLEVDYNLNVKFFEDKQVEVNKGIGIIKELKLSRLEEEYLLDNMAYTLETKADDDEIDIASVYKGVRIAQNRLMDYPREYKVNSFYLDVITFNEVKKNFTYWLSHDSSKINYNVFKMYESMVGKKANGEIIDFIEKNFIEGRSYYQYVRQYIYNNPYPIETYPNINYLTTIQNRSGYRDAVIYYNKLKELKNLWDKVSSSAQLEILEMEAYVEETYFLDRMLTDDVLAKQIANEMVERNRPYKFVDFYLKTEKIECIDNETIKKIVQLLITYKESLKSNIHESNNDNKIKEIELEITSLQEYMKIKGMN